MPNINAIQRKNLKKFIGATGTEVYGGRFDEDYLSKLNGPQAAEIFDKMRRSDAKIKQVLAAIKNPIRSSKFVCEPNKEHANAKLAQEASDFCNWHWNNNPYIDLDQFYNEILTHLDFGYSVHEGILAFMPETPYGMVHVIGGLGFRKQETIEEWNIKGREGLTWIRQQVSGDTADDSSIDVYIPVERLLICTNEQEGDNYEGISLLRAAYGSWLRKQTYLKLMAIGVEKAAIGTPVGKWPNEIENENDKAEFKVALTNLSTNQQNFIGMPDAYSVDILKIDFDAEKIKAAITYEDGQIAAATLMSFLELGMNGSGGSFSLGSDLSDISLASIRFIASKICKKISMLNRKLVEMNFGDPELNPLVKSIGIDKKAGTDFSNAIGILVEKGIIRPDDRLEAFVREKMHLPEFEKSRAEDPVANPLQPEPTPKPTDESESEADPDDDDGDLSQDKEAKDGKKSDSNQRKGRNFQDEDFSPSRELTEAEKPIDLKAIEVDFETETTRLQMTMQTQLGKLVDFTVKKLENELKTRGNDTDRITVLNRVNIDVNKYQDILEREFGRQVGVGTKQAQRDLAAKGVKEFAETAAFKAQTEHLPSHVKAGLKAQARQQAKSHKLKLEDIVVFAGVAGADDNRTDAQVIAQIQSKMAEFIAGQAVASAARTVSSQNINRGRNAFFLGDDAISQITAFQYSAVIDGRTTDICLSLDGQIFAPGQASLRFRPPNHFGCRSILVPITVNEKIKTNVEKLAPDAENPALLAAKKAEGKPVPSKAKIMGSKNLVDGNDAILS